MKTWKGKPLYECSCGFATLDKDALEGHLRYRKHKPKEDPAAEIPVKQDNTNEEKQTVKSKKHTGEPVESEEK